MKTPDRLEPLVQEGLVDEVVRQLMSGKEATVYVVRCGEDIRCAKVYKDVDKRSFRQSALYRDGRAVKSSRQARAMAKGSRFGRKSAEETWQSAEVDALHRLAIAGVRVPQPYGFHQGVLLMELVADADGNVAPRLNELVLTPERALEYHAFLIGQVVRMLCAGIVHGDLSEYNVLVDAVGPVVIDLPQAVDAAANNNAAAMLQRDVDNLRSYFGRFAPELLTTRYAEEIWALYAAGSLTPEAPLTGHFETDEGPADLEGVMREIDAAQAAEDALRRHLAQAAQPAEPAAPHRRRNKAGVR